jgi:hypothetical protein
MFHNVEHCSVRNNLITEISKNKQGGLDIPVRRFGKWIIDDKYIQVEAIHSTRMGNSGSNQSGNAILSRLQRLFAEDPKGKGKSVDEQMNNMNSKLQRHFLSPRTMVNMLDNLN